MTHFKRRQFLELATLLAAGSMVHAGPAGSLAGGGCARAAAKKMVGIQTYMVRDALAKDVTATLEHLATAGYRELELFGFGGSDNIFGMTLTAFSDLVSRLGLKVPSAHIVDKITDRGAAREIADALGIQYLIEPLAAEFRSEWSMHEKAESVAQVRSLADRLNRRGEFVAELGYQFAYHNHAVEFTRVEGRLAWDLLMELTDPELVKIELDLGWVSSAGFDPVSVLKQYSGRVVATHMKDFNPNIKLPPATGNRPFPIAMRLVPPGKGTSDFAAISRQLDADNVKHRFVEVDVSDDPLADADFGLCHLVSFG